MEKSVREEAGKNGSWKRRLGALGLALTLALSLAGCGGKSGAGTADEPSVSPAASNAASAAPAGSAAPASTAPSAAPAATDTAAPAATVYPLTVKDATGTDVVLNAEPKRIVTLAPSETETAFAVGAGERVMGVDQFSDYPKEAAQKAKIGDINTNVEAVLALKPDLVLAHNGLQPDVIKKLRELKVTVYAGDPKTLDQVIGHVEIIGKLLNEQVKAAQVADKMKADRDRIVAAVKDAPKKKVYLEFSPGWSVGKGEFLDELLTLAGGTNVAGDQKGWFEINAESIIKSNPQVILYGTDAMTGNTIYDAIMKRPGFSALAAVKSKDIHPVDSSLVTRTGPRLTDGLVEIAKAVHPDKVN